MNVDTANAVVLRAGRLDDEAAFVELFNSTYLRKIDGRYFRWQFFDREVPGLLTVGEDQNHLIASHGAHVQMATANNERLRLMFNVDTIIAAGYRGAGMYAGLIERTLESADVAGMYCLANENAFRALTRLMGWKCAATLPMMCVESHAVPPANGALAIERTSAFDEEMANAIIRLRGVLSDRLIVAREPEFLHWRFTHNPWHRYTLLRAVRNGRLFGWLALKSFRDPATGNMSGDVVDMVWTENDVDLLAELLAAAVREFSANGIRNVAAWLHATPLVEAGRTLGFCESSPSRYLCCKPSSRHHAWLADGHGWHVTLADAEFT